MSKVAIIKTQETTESVRDFINKLSNEQQRADSIAIIELMKTISGEEPKMWGDSIIGFGNKRYKSPKTGREVDWFIIGFSPRKANFSIYLSLDIQQYKKALEKLGKHKTGVGCLYIKKLTEIDLDILKEMIESAIKENMN